MPFCRPGIEHERWEPQPDVPALELVGRHSRRVRDEDRRAPKRAALCDRDVIDVKPDTPNLDAMLLKFSSEHWHDEDECVSSSKGADCSTFNPPGGVVFAIEVERGDLIRVPKGTTIG